MICLTLHELFKIGRFSIIDLLFCHVMNSIPTYRKTTIQVPHWCYISITPVPTKGYSSTTRVKLQYHLSNIKSGTGYINSDNILNFRML